MTHRSRGPTDLDDRHLHLVPPPAPPRVPRPRASPENAAPPPRLRRSVTRQVLLLLAVLAVVGVAAVALATSLASDPQRPAPSATDHPRSSGSAAVPSLPVLPADLGLDRRVEVTPRGRVLVRLSVTNRGPAAAAGVRVVATLPSGVRYLESPGSACRTTATGVRCGLGRLRPGATAEALVVASTPDRNGSDGLLRWVTAGAAHAHGRTSW